MGLTGAYRETFVWKLTQQEAWGLFLGYKNGWKMLFPISMMR